MKLKVGNTVFDNSAYDERGDVLYLSVGEPRTALAAQETPEGHVIRFGEGDEIIGLTIVSAQHWLDQDGVITITMPDRHRIERAELAPILN